jgi:hypothetical protein
MNSKGPRKIVVSGIASAIVLGLLGYAWSDFHQSLLDHANPHWLAAAALALVIPVIVIWASEQLEKRWWKEKGSRAVMGAFLVVALFFGFMASGVGAAKKTIRTFPASARCAASPSNDATALPLGWQRIGDARISRGGIPGSICLHSDQLYWGGIYNPTVPGCDYTISADGRLNAEEQGWGLAARTSIAADGTVTGHALQYENVQGGRGNYRDVDYPSDVGRWYPQLTDTAWHHLSETVRGDYYMLIVDDQKVAEGSLSSWDQDYKLQSEEHHQAETCGGVFVRMFSGGTVELQNLNITRD